MAFAGRSSHERKEASGPRVAALQAATMTEASTRSGGARIAVVVLGTAAVLGGAYALTPPERPDDGKLQRVTPQLPPLFAVESAAAAVSRAFDAAAFAEPEPDYHSGAIA